MFIDIHVHTHQKRHPTIRRQEDLKSWSTPEQLVDAMDKAGIDKAVVQGCASPECRYTLVTPEEAIDICREYTERLVPFCNFDPRFLPNSSESDYMPLLTAYKEVGFKGIGEHTPNIPFDDPRNTNFFRQVGESNLPLCFHVATSKVDNMDVTMISICRDWKPF